MLLSTVWRVALAPALRTLQEAPAQQALLDQKTQHMLALQTQANALQQRGKVSRADALQWLDRHLDTLGEDAQISVQDDRVRLRLQKAPPDALAQWLVQAREQALVLPIDAQLQRSAPPNATFWRGSMTLRLP